MSDFAYASQDIGDLAHVIVQANNRRAVSFAQEYGLAVMPDSDTGFLCYNRDLDAFLAVAARRRFSTKQGY